MTFSAQTDPMTAMDRGLSRRERSRLMPGLRTLDGCRGRCPRTPEVFPNRRKTKRPAPLTGAERLLLLRSSAPPPVPPFRSDRTCLTIRYVFCSRNTSAGGQKASSAERPQQLAADDMALDLGGPFPDALHPRVAPDPLERQFVHQSHAA